MSAVNWVVVSEFVIEISDINYLRNISILLGDTTRRVFKQISTTSSSIHMIDSQNKC
jgi:hypothetical protein